MNNLEVVRILIKYNIRISIPLKDFRRKVLIYKLELRKIEGTIHYFKLHCVSEGINSNSVIVNEYENNNSDIRLIIHRGMDKHGYAHIKTYYMKNRATLKEIKHLVIISLCLDTR